MSSKINWDSQEAIALYIVGGLVVGFLAKSALSSKPTAAVKEEKQEAAPEEEPESRDVTDELTGKETGRPSDANTEIMDHGDDEGWKIGTGGKKSRKRRKNKSRKSRPKSKRRTKK